MIKKQLVLIGAGGHAKSIIDSINEDEIEIIGFIDDNKRGLHYGIPILGSKIESIENYHEYYYFVSIGDVQCREKWFEKVKVMNLETLNIIDKTAYVSKTAQLGKGNFIGKHAIINADSIIGNDNVINTRALVEHECIVGNHVHLSTNSVINGNVEIGDRVFLGSMAVCNGQQRIESDVTIGSGSVVINNIESCCTVVGVPARVIKRRNVNESH